MPEFRGLFNGLRLPLPLFGGLPCGFFKFSPRSEAEVLKERSCEDLPPEAAPVLCALLPGLDRVSEVDCDGDEVLVGRLGDAV